MHELHKEINDRIAQNNTNYKLQGGVRKRLKTFNVGDFVMVRICPERFPGIVKRLHACSVGPLQILKKLNDYVIDLPKNFGISSYSMSKT